MLKEDKQKEGFHVVTLPSSSLAACLNFVTAANNSLGIKIVSPHRTLGSTTSNMWLSLRPNQNTAPLIVTMMLWK
jgi:hypothetical protein